ncbi:LSU ribosomal protein L14p (L23e) [Candidatus Vidania fulgoroideae]|nr:LSU ribosomal protein L14p (L23e) [Candidatus Vidania fulgoroideae]
MIIQGTICSSADNSGAKKSMCIKVLGNNKKVAKICDIIKITVKKCSKKSKVKKGQIYNAIVVRTKYGLCRKDGTKISFLDNSIVLLDRKFEMVGTRVKGIIPLEIKETDFEEIISLAKYVF